MPTNANPENVMVQYKTRMDRRFLIIGLIAMLIYGCQSRSVSDNIDNHYNNERILIKNSNTTESIDDPNCDTTKLKGFKNNLTTINEKRPEYEYNSYDNMAKSYIDKECKKDTLFCGDIKREVVKAYHFDSEFKLYLVGYTYDNAEGMDENSVSLFVLTVYMNDKLIFSDVLADLVGEIQTELNGLEVKDSSVIVWGHTYPYFGTDYGKFKLTISQGNGIYEFQCHGHQI